jgi:hypothetical protein
MFGLRLCFQGSAALFPPGPLPPLPADPHFHAALFHPLSEDRKLPMTRESI